MPNQALSNLLANYFDRPTKRLLNETFGQNAPISVKPGNWTILKEPERFVKVYKFSNAQKLNSFVSELLAYEHDKKHFAKILIEKLEIRIEVNTKIVERIR